MDSIFPQLIVIYHSFFTQKELEVKSNLSKSVGRILLYVTVMYQMYYIYCYIKMIWKATQFVK